jgi:hypothetical protein
MFEIPDMNARDRVGLSKTFRYFAEVETPKLNSRVYTDYSFGVVEDDELLDLCGSIDASQPAPNILFASVQDLLLADPAASPEAEALVVFYPAITGKPMPDHSPWDAFRAFCHAHAKDLAFNLRNGKTQTCVVHRCATVLPALATLPAIEDSNGRVGLLEIGPSAGLNLRLDHYRFDYGGGIGWGDSNARPKLFCASRGALKPPMPERLEVVARRGLDLNPIDLDDPKAIRWLRALIWPEHAERAKAMEEALVHAQTIPVEIEKGDATREIEAHIARLPQDAARVLFATHVFYQIPTDGRLEILEGIARASRDHPVDLILVEGTGEGDSRIEWFHFADGERGDRVVLARADSHGRWIEWGAR